MNKELELEAEKYAELFRFKVEAERSWFQAKKEDFIAGATSNYVEKQKLEFAIEQLESLKDVEHSDNFWYLENKILELKQKLSEL